MTRSAIFLLLGFALFAGCRKDYDINTEKILGPIPTANVQATLTGRVLDDQANPIVGAQVQVAGLNYITDERGMFFVHQKLMNKNGAYVQVSQNGFFDAGRFAFPTLGNSTYIEIKMIPKGVPTTFDASAGGTFKGYDGNTDGAEVIIPANAIARAGGAPYTGPVKAYAMWLRPDDPSTFSRMPGDLRAEDAEGYAKVLTTFGMIGVELESPSGEPLNLLPGKTATVSMRVPGAVLANAPATIPTWHFDETNGYWKEEGEATLSGSEYVFEVAHFSFWNCDIPTDYIILNGRLTEPGGQPLTNFRISLSHETFGTGIGYTDEDGHFGGIVPANVQLDLQILSVCGNVLLEQTVGPFTQNTDLGDLEMPGLETATVTGTLLDCNSSPLVDGLVVVGKGDTVFVALTTDENGHFTITLADCIGFYDLSITGFDLVNLFQSPTVDVDVIDGAADAGMLQVCGNLDQYVRVTVDGITQTFAQNLSFIETSATEGYIDAAYTSDSMLVRLNFKTYQDLQAQTATVALIVRDAGNVLHSFACSYCPGCGCDENAGGTIQFTQFPTAPGQYAEGSVQGQVMPQFGPNTVPYSVQFRVKKQ